MATTTITLKDKGQVTIPAGVRDEMGLQTGESFSVQHDGSRIILVRQSGLVDSLAGCLAEYADSNQEPEINRDETWVEIARRRYNRLQRQLGLPEWERDVE